ncbi:MAG: class II fructose-bisphosphate aldolase [Sulfuricella sp.]|nr:class II fructose-bisphosphate aldolase [Sulfuricella sp.]
MKANLTGVLQAAAGGIGSFNVLDLDMAQAVLDAAEAARRPVIVGIASRHWDSIRAPRLAPSLLAMIEQATVPAALHLDHANERQLDMIRAALDLGFTSIMIDGSHLPFSKNAALTARVVELARDYGAGVEGELGGIAGEEGVADTGADSPEQMPYTDPAEATRFVAETGVDALAVAVGTAHGIYKHEPKIDFDTIRNVAKATPVPLVMHGATGISNEVIRLSVQIGIRKINYFSGLLAEGINEIRETAKLDGYDFLGFKQRLAARWKADVRRQIELYAG